MSVHELELDLEAFEGPFDLLLTLVLKEEVPLADVDVAGIVLAFVEELAEREQLDLEACGEFLVLVSSLLELKARALVAGEDVDLEELDPEEAAEELARRLAEYRRFKEASHWLAERLAASATATSGSGRRRSRRSSSPSWPPRSRSCSQRRCAGSRSSLRRSRSRTWRSASRRSRSSWSASGRCSAGAAASTSSRRSSGLTIAEQAVAFLALLELRKRGRSGDSRRPRRSHPIRVSRTGEETPAASERRTASTLRSA